ncbi:hypothetical protein BN1708_020374, partial [Verticillium longisporum]
LSHPRRGPSTPSGSRSLHSQQGRPARLPPLAKEEPRRHPRRHLRLQHYSTSPPYRVHAQPRCRARRDRLDQGLPQRPRPRLRH